MIWFKVRLRVRVVFEVRAGFKLRSGLGLVLWQVLSLG